jgi:hypothetical protein
MKQIHFLLILIFVTGCSSKPEGFPAVYPCSVTVVNGETPIEGATVTFNYDTGAGAPVTVSAITGKNGIAVMNSMQASHEVKGAPAGQCKVVVVKNNFVPDTKTAEEKKMMSIEEAEAWKQSLVDAANKLPREVPEILESSLTTPITIEVPASSSTHTIDVSTYRK